MQIPFSLWFSVICRERQFPVFFHLFRNRLLTRAGIFAIINGVNLVFAIFTYKVLKI